MSQTIQTYLSKVLVNQFPQTGKNQGKVVRVNLTDSISSVMKVLSEHDIYSAPVYDEQTNQWVGMVDMIDIAEFVANNFDEVQMRDQGFEVILDQAEKFASTKVSDITDISQTNPFVPVPDDADMRQIARLLADREVHRVNVFDAKGDLVNVISQSAVLSQIVKHLEYLGSLGEETIESLGIGTSPVKSIDIEEQTVNAFRLLRKEKLYAVPVLAEGLVVGNVSAKDVRECCSHPSRLYLLYAPVRELLKTIHQDEVDIRVPAIACNKNDTLAHVIQLITTNRIHRIYVMDDNHLSRVVTLTDIIQVLFK